MTTASANDDDNFGTEQGQKIINSMLGTERRNRVLAGLYMGRSDVALMVRQSALHVWKVIVFFVFFNKTMGQFIKDWIHFYKLALRPCYS